MTRKQSRRPGLIGRALSMMAFLPVASRAPMYARLIWALVQDGRVPLGRKALLAGALGYLVLGRDLVPDEVPIVGGLDDLIVVVVAVELFLDGVPELLLDEKLDELGIDRAAYERDVDRVRRLIPRPLRRAVHELPRAADAAADMAARSGLGARLRAMRS
ncbi:MAG TPA: YkvA family protein [Candidatus Dormibacteraeota bacterium]|nr:YkvA family protein [Candidatus Dormibacteraeota bacterium]